MKKLNLFSLLVFIIALTSCDSDDSTSNNLEINDANLVGNWKLTSGILNGSPIFLDSCELEYTIKLSIDEDGNKLANFVEGAMGGLDEECRLVDSAQYVWYVSNNFLHTQIADNSFDKDSLRIIELTPNKLSLEETGLEDGVDFFAIIETFTKQ